MANPTTKFVSVNLNKSYGQQQTNRPSSSPSPYHGGIASRANRPGGGSSAGGGGGGMVVLSRPRSSVPSGPKSGARLAVPPPLNLPSLRKEHERFDPSAGSGSLSGASSSGLGLGRGGSAVMGWNKPSTALLGLQDKDGLPRELTGRPGSGDQRVGSPVGGYMPAATKSGAPPRAAASPTPALSTVQRAVLLKGEDFPSLQASIISNQKQKDVAGLKQKQLGGEELHDGQVDKTTTFASSIPMRPQMRPSHSDSFKELNGDGGSNRTSGGSSKDRSSHKLDEILPGPLPMVQLRHTSDWADDERDTGLAIPERSKVSRSEASRNYDYYDDRSLHDSVLVGASRKDISKADSFGRDTLASDRNANSWRSSMHPKDGFGARESALLDRDGPLARVSSHGKDSLKDGSKYGQYSNGGRDGSDIQQSRADFNSYGQNFRSTRNGMDAYNRRNSEQNLPGRLAEASTNRFKGGSLQNNSFSSASVSSGGKGFPLDDPILNFRRFPTSSRKPYIDGANFDDQDTLTAGILGDVGIKPFRKKKDVPAQVELNDPVRESFEAELERVQRLQEEERQRVLQEHARALELARKEEEERQRLAREEEERRIRLEQEAREAAWRAEQEKLEAARITEEKRVAREEEKKRILMEEERRKEAARQKLLELEARIAKRQAEETEKGSRSTPFLGGNDQMLGEVKQLDAQKFADSGEWEDGERMVEQITSSTLSDLPSTNRYYGQGSSLPSSANGYTSAKESGKPSTYWKNEAYDNGSNSAVFAEQANGHHAPRRDAFNTGRVITRKNVYSNSGGAPARPSSKGAASEAPPPFVDEYYPNLRGQRWSIPGDGDRFLRNNNAETDQFENDKFAEIEWERNRSSDGPVALYGDSLFQNSGVEGFSSGRSRYFLRQPRVLPPPSISSIPKNTFKMNSERANSAAYLENENRHHNTEKGDKETRHETYDGGYLESREQYPAASMSLEASSLAAQNEKNSSSLSQSSVSVSSPPSSPANMYHDELDDTGDLPVLPESADDREIALSEDDCDINATESGKTNNAMGSRSLASREEDEWTVENNDDIHAQDEYDEEHDYQEEADVHEDEDGIDIVQELYLHSDIQNGSADLEQDQPVLGFNEGTEVRITSSDEFEIESENDEKDIEAQVIPNVVRQETASADELLNNEGSLETVASFLDGSQENSEILKTTEKAMQNLVLEPVVSTSYSLTNQGMASQPSLTSAFNISSLPSSLGQPILSSTSTVHGQTETPMQLQFGLFSGPSLIPSPVPAIQIGSIQMPLSLHHHVRPFPHIHPSQPPFFQFGQLQYTSPISQGILPLNPQNMPFLQNSVSAQYPLTQSSGNSLQKHVIPQSSALNSQKEGAGLSVQYKNGVVENSSEFSGSKIDLKEQSGTGGEFVNSTLRSTEQVDVPSHSKDRLITQTASQVNVTVVHDDALRRSGGLISSNDEQYNEREEPVASQCIPEERPGLESRRPGSSSTGRGKRYVYAIKNSNSRSQLPESEVSRVENNVFQRRIRRNTRRTEFRVRESDKKQINGLDSFNSRIQDGKHQLNGDASGFYSRTGYRKENSSNRSTRSMAESEKFSTDVMLYDAISSEAVTKTLTSSNSYPPHSDGSLHRNDSEEDVDAPLLTGIVRVYKQPGIETPSDEDNFIEVRSKRQMLNDRREQREKEIKAKSRTLKAQQRARSLNHGMIASKAASREGLKSVPRSVTTEGSNIAKDVLSSTVKVGSQTPLANGHPTGNLDSDSGSLHTNSVQMSSSGGSSLGTMQNFAEVMFENTTFTNVSTRTTTPATSAERHLNQQAIPLTQTQLDEAMKPAYTCGAFRNNHSDTIDSTKSSTSANPVSSLLAGEKIQFGAVTTPTYLPPVNRVIHNSGGGLRTSCKSDPIERKSASRNDDTIFFNNEKHHDQSCVHLVDAEAEAEAEAAASAVAVAAISSDEIVSNDTAKDNSQEAKNLSAGEESLIVSLPADLSVENPPSLWPILPSPQSSSNPMLSHFAGASPSHFPFFDMNPMLRGPMFTFGAQDDSVGTQSQQQKSSSLSSGPFGAWPQCPSGMDSIYGHPAGFAGPFLNPAAGMPGVQAPHPMVFYNHFSPLAQFGVSFMGGPFIPSGKQPEWRHNHLTSVGVSEPNISTQDACSAQNNPASIAASIQHLAPGSLMPVASPLPLFEMPPFQQPVDLPVPPQWHNMTPPVHSIPLSPLSHHRLDGGMPAQVNHTVPMHPSNGVNGVSSLDSQSSVAADAKFVFRAHPAAQLSNELGLVEPSNSDGGLSNQSLYSTLCRNIDGLNDPKTTSSNNSHVSEAIGSVSAKQNEPKSSSSSNTHVSEATISVSTAASSNTQNTRCVTKAPTVTQPPVSSTLPHSNPSGYNEKRAGSSQKVVPGGDWHRRGGFQARKPIQGSEKNFAASKMKQIYVAKSPVNGAATTG